MLSATFIGFIKERKNFVLLIAALVGVALIFAAVMGTQSTSDARSDGGALTLDEYKRTLEDELSSLCSRVSGAGKCIVSVSFSEGERLEYKGSSLVGRQPPRVAGVTVLASGGGNDYVKREISELISALFGIGHNRICVLKLSS